MSIETETNGNQNGHYSSKKYKKVPPEGGFGYFVAVGLAVSFVSSLLSSRLCNDCKSKNMINYFTLQK